MRPHRWQPTRLPHPWDSQDKNTGVGCHFLLQCVKVESESEVAQSCPTSSNPMDCSPPGSSVHGIFPGKSTGVGCQCLLQDICQVESNQSAISVDQKQLDVGNFMWFSGVLRSREAGSCDSFNRYCQCFCKVVVPTYTPTVTCRFPISMAL